MDRGLILHKPILPRGRCSGRGWKRQHHGRLRRPDRRDKACSDTVTGTYNIASDGTGTATISFSNGGVIRWALTVVSTSKVLFTTPVVDSGSVALGADINKQKLTLGLR